jgi:hypothetical protein
MVFDPTNYLDIWNIFAFEIVGGVNLVIILGLIAIAFFSAKNAVPFQTGIAFLILWVAVISILTSNIGLWTLVVLAVGLLFYWIMARMFRRN